MRVLVTGVGGNLGRVLVPALVDAGHEPVLLDFRPVDSPHRTIVADVRDADAMWAACDGVDAVVHGAAVHGVHLDRRPPEEFWDVNATGTFTVYQAARAAGVGRVVLASSMVVYGADPAARPDRWSVVTEDTPCLPDNVYGLTKVAAEEIARLHARSGALTTVSLRLGMFVPESFERYGFRLLFGGVDDRDVAQATLCGLTHEPDGGFDAFDIMAPTRLGEDDLAALAADPGAAVERRYPGTAAVVERLGLDLGELIWGRTLWPVDRARAVLGYRPEYDFARFLAALDAGDRSLYPFADLPWWGV